MLTHRRLRLLGHILRMDEDRLPRKLQVCAPSQGRQNDQVVRELRSCESDLNGDWRTIAQDQSAWKSKNRTATQKLGITKEAQEKNLKDEQKRHREARQY